MDQRSVLIADDEPSIVDVCKRYLEREGFDIFTAADGQEALDVWRKHHPD
ncbi:response regulator, partial [Halobacillus sp. BBL2006]